MKSRKLLQAFTMIELLAVLAIIGILASIISRGGVSIRQQAYRKQAAATISALEVSIEMYESDVGTYPTDDLGLDCDAMYNDLITGGHGPYIELNDDQVSAGQVIDPWGNAFRYDCLTPVHNTTAYDLWSCGPDGKNGNSDDVKNW